jgi:hypothetical protein
MSPISDGVLQRRIRKAISESIISIIWKTLYRLSKDKNTNPAVEAGDYRRVITQQNKEINTAMNSMYRPSQ